MLSIFLHMYTLQGYNMYTLQGYNMYTLQGYNMYMQHRVHVRLLTCHCVVWDGASHKWEQDQWNGIETILQPALRAVVEVEDQNPHQVHDEGQDEQVANEALLLVDLALSASTQLLNGLCGERGRGREGEGERGRERERGGGKREREGQSLYRTIHKWRLEIFTLSRPSSSSPLFFGFCRTEFLKHIAVNRGPRSDMKCLSQRTPLSSLSSFSPSWRTEDP